jgi:hypothetical protein
LRIERIREKGKERMEKKEKIKWYGVQKLIGRKEKRERKREK